MMPLMHPFCGGRKLRCRSLALALCSGDRHRMKALLYLALLLSSVAPCVASRIVTDEVGRRVELPDHPHRIICLVPSVTDTVFALGAGADVVAVSDFTKYPVEALKKPSVGSTTRPSIETILSLHPDLVLGIQTGGPGESTAAIERLGIPIYLVGPHGLDGILRSVTSLGDALNRKAEAASLVTKLEGRISAVRTRTQTLPRPAVFMPVWYDPIITIGKHAFITEIIEVAGGRSITDDLTPDWPHLSLEALIARAPEALLLVRGGRTTLEVLKDRPGWNSIPAIRERRVFYVDNRIDFPSPVAIDALEDMSRQFHP